MNYPTLSRYKRGYVTWKFVFTDRVIYRLKNYDALQVYKYYRNTQPFTVYFQARKGWELVTSCEPSDYCQCGRSYTDTPNGEPFQFQDHPLEFTIRALAELMKSPVLCIVCYYKDELKHGRWAPLYVRKILGLET